MGALGAEAGGELGFLTGAAGEGERAEGFGGGEIGGCAELRGGVAEDAALESDGLSGEGGDVESEAFGAGSGAGAASAADGTAREGELGGEAGGFSGQEGFFIAGQRRHVGKMLSELGVEGFELRQELVADAVAGEGGIGVGGVGAPGLAQGTEEGFDFGAGDGEEGTQDFALILDDDGVDAG